MTFNCILPFAAWGFFFGFLRKKEVAWRTAFLATSVAWGITLAILTELLGFFELLNRSFLSTGWGVVAFTAGALFFRNTSLTVNRAFPSPPALLREAQGGGPHQVRNLCRLDKVIVFAIACILAATLVQGLVSPPNNYDSMTYHMSRIMHWIQQGSVAHFPSNVLRQLELNPWAEFAMMHMQILTSGDHLANLVQWYSMLGCIVGVSYIAALLGSGVRGQLLSAFMAATIPMAVLQASSTQNDLVVSFWLVCFVSFGLLSVKERSYLWTGLMSMSLGLAILTKGTAYIYAFPFILWFLLQDIKKLRSRIALKKYLFIAFVVLLINFGHYTRDFQLFHSPLHSGKDRYANARFTPLVLFSSITRNVVIHTLTPFYTINEYEISVVKALHSATGVDIYDPRTTWPGTSFDKLRFAPSEDSSGNPFHFCCFVIAFALLVRMRGKEWTSYPLRYSATAITAFILFCGVLRWQPWHSRLHLPLFMLFSPVAGIVGELIEAEWLFSILTFSFSLLACAWIMLNHSRPMVSLARYFPTHPPSIFTTSRNLLYLNNLPAGNRESYLAAAQRINSGKFKNVGLRFNDDQFEYPIWALTRDRDGRGPRIEDIDFDNFSKAIPERPFSPDIILYISEDGNVIVGNQ